LTNTGIKHIGINAFYLQVKIIAMILDGAKGGMVLIGFGIKGCVGKMISSL